MIYLTNKFKVETYSLFSIFVAMNFSCPWSIHLRLGGGLVGVACLPSAGIGSGYISVGPFPPMKC